MNKLPDTFEGRGLSENLPEFKIKNLDLKKGISLLDFLTNNKITTSKSDARRLINNNGLKINNNLLIDEKKILNENDFQDKVLKISCGKKKHFLVKIS